MSTLYIPQTDVRAEVIDPPSGSDFVSLFLKQHETGNGKYTASVNAGTSNTGSVFAVGLGGINGAFASSLSSAGQDTSQYQGIHQHLYDTATALSAYKADFDSNAPVRFSLMLKPDPSHGLPGYDGIVFIDVFKTDEVPNQNALNSAMIYVVPPASSNYSDENAFLTAIEASCQTISDAVGSYNGTYAVPGNSYKLDPIGNIRMCLFSGGIYRGSASVSDVALHNLKGLEKGLSKTSTGIDCVGFENSEGAFDSIKDKLADSPA